MSRFFAEVGINPALHTDGTIIIIITIIIKNHLFNERADKIQQMLKPTYPVGCEYPP